MAKSYDGSITIAINGDNSGLKKELKKTKSELQKYDQAMFERAFAEFGEESEKIDELREKIEFLSKQKHISNFQIEQLEKYKKELKEIEDEYNKLNDFDSVVPENNLHDKNFNDVVITGLEEETDIYENQMQQNEEISQNKSEQLEKEKEIRAELEKQNKELLLKEKHSKDIKAITDFYKDDVQDENLLDVDVKIPEEKIDFKKYNLELQLEKEKLRIIKEQNAIKSGQSETLNIEEEINALNTKYDKIFKEYEKYQDLLYLKSKGVELTNEEKQAMTDAYNIGLEDAYNDANEELDKLIQKQYESVNKTEEHEKRLEVEKLKYIEIIQKLDEYNNKQKEINSENTKGIEGIGLDLKKINKDLPNAIDKVSSKITGVIRKIGKWALALIGIRTLMNLLQQSFSTLSQYNTELSNKMQSARLVLAVGLEPVIKRIVGLVETLLSLLNFLSKGLFGVDLFAKAAEYATQKTADNLGAGASAAAEIKKSLAGFDEMNILQNTSASGGAGAGGGGGTNGFEFNLDENDLWRDWNLDNIIKKGKEIAEKLAEGINDVLRKTDWRAVGETLSKAIKGVIDTIDTFIKNIDWYELGQSLVDFLFGFDWAGLAVSVMRLIKDAILGSLDLLIGYNNAIADEFNNPAFRTKVNRAGKAIGEEFTGGIWDILTKFIVELIPSLWERLKAEAKALWTVLDDLALKGASWFTNLINGTDIEYDYIVQLQRQYNETVDLTFAIGDLKDIEEEYAKLKDELTRKEDAYLRAIDNQERAEQKLIEMQNNLGISYEDLKVAVDNGTLSYKLMSPEQREVYKAGRDLEQANRDLEAAEKGVNQANENLDWNKLREEMVKVKDEVNKGKYSWEDYAKEIVEGFNNGEIEAEEAGNKIMFAMVQMDDKTREVFQKSIPKKLSDAYKLPTTLEELKKEIDKLNEKANNVGNDMPSNIDKNFELVYDKAKGWVDKISGLEIGVKAKIGAGMKTGGIVSVPKLATGAIINQPGSGIPVGGGTAYGGEAGREGIIPLTDNQAMEILGRAIGRYVNINATIPVKIGDRQVAREIRNIMAESDFAFNR